MIETLRLQNAPDTVTIQVREKMSNHKGEIVQSKVGNPAQRADHGAFFLARFPGQLMWPGGMILAILATALPPFTHGFGADTVASGQNTSTLLGAGDFGTDNWSGTGV